MSNLPGSLIRTPDLDRWIAIENDGSIIVSTGKVELGQGILTAIQLIAAEELDVDPDQVQVRSAETGITPNEMVTAGSMSVETSGAAVRQACAWARRLMLSEVSDDPAQLEVSNGIVTGPGLNAPTSYTEIQAGTPFKFQIVDPTQEKDPSKYKVLGRDNHVRIDLEDKIRGVGVFVHDLEFPDMLHARIIRPPSYHHRLKSVDLTQIEAPDLGFVDGSFIAVMSTDEYRATRLAESVGNMAIWTQTQEIPADNPLPDYLVAHETSAFPILDNVPQDVPPRSLTTAINAVYSRPFLMHGSLGPSAAAAHLVDGILTVWSPSQGIELIRHTLAQLLAMDAKTIRVIYIQGAGCYGHNAADDATVDAALCARAAPGRPVLLKWSRADEHQWEPYGPAMRVGMGANLSDRGDVDLWTHDVWSFSHVGRPAPGRTGMDIVAAWHLNNGFEPNEPAPRLGSESGIHRNALPIYEISDQQVVKRFVSDSPLRTSALRSLGAQCNVFAIESFMDELALAANTDPVTFRLRHLQDTRAIAVLQRVVELAGGVSGSRGIGLAQYKNRQCYAAVVAEVVVDTTTAEVRVTHLWIAADAGRVVDRDGLTNQLEGGAIQALSWCLKEAVTFDRNGITSRDWETYPILRFSEIPLVETDVIDRPQLESLGAGEATQGPTSGALANAIYAATSIRVRNMPFTPQHLREAAAD